MQQCDKMRELSLPFCAIPNNHLRCLQQAPSTIGAQLFADIMLRWRQDVKGHILSSLLAHIAKP